MSVAKVHDDFVGSYFERVVELRRVRDSILLGDGIII